MRAFLTRDFSSSVRAFGLALAALALGVLAGCTTPKYPPAPVDAQTADYNYRIGPLDTVNVIVWRNPDLSIAVPVRPDGKITTPLVDDMVAIGKTPTELERDIEKALTKFIRDPVVTIVVTNFAGPVNEQIRVTGEATKPQIMPYRKDMTLLDVMIAVGGLTDFADGNKAIVIRNVGGKQLQANMRIDDLIKDGDISANVPMMPGDILIIPESWF